jgi:ligand-binding sensor domain-containing protein
VGFHRSTLTPTENRPRGGLALPDDIRDVWFTSDSYWVATSQGVCRVKDGVVEQFTENEGLASELTYGVGRSAAGQVLLATHGGLGRFVDGSWYFDLPAPLDAAARAIIVRDHATWLGTSRGVVLKDPDGVKIYGANKGLASDSVIDIYLEGNKRLWVLTDQGLSFGKVEGL